MGILIDTCVLIDAERGDFDLTEFSDANPGRTFFISVMTTAELLHGVERLKSATKASRHRQEFVEGVIQKYEIVDFDLAVARKYAAVSAKLSNAGVRIPPPDLLIAATALQHGFSVATFNTRDFEKIPGLKLMRP